MASLTVTQAAERLGMHPRTVRRLCEDFGIGIKVSKRFRLIEERDLKKLARNRRPVGNPNFSARRKSNKRKGL